MTIQVLYHRKTPMSSTREKLDEDFGQRIGKAEEILANQREGQWRREGKTTEMREEGENRLKMERAAEREKGSEEKMGTARMGKGEGARTAG